MTNLPKQIDEILLKHSCFITSDITREALRKELTQAITTWAFDDIVGEDANYNRPGTSLHSHWEGYNEAKAEFRQRITQSMGGRG